MMTSVQDVGLMSRPVSDLCATSSFSHPPVFLHGLVPLGSVSNSSHTASPGVCQSSNTKVTSESQHFKPRQRFAVQWSKAKTIQTILLAEY